MPGDIPNRATTGTRAADAFNRVRETLRSHVPALSAGARTSHTVHGVFREPEESPRFYGVVETEAATSGMVFLGGWSSAVEYNSQEVVFYTPSGGSAGAYIGLADSIPIGTTPDTGSPWWCAWPYPPPGVWG